jgi:hypothetical protein
VCRDGGLRAGIQISQQLLSVHYVQNPLQRDWRCPAARKEILRKLCFRLPRNRCAQMMSTFAGANARAVNAGNSNGRGIPAVAHRRHDHQRARFGRATTEAPRCSRHGAEPAVKRAETPTGSVERVLEIEPVKFPTRLSGLAKCARAFS